MLGRVTIQWCPSCQAWGKARCLGVDVLDGHTEVGDLGMVAVSYRRERLHCAACESQFVKTSLNSRDPVQSWRVQRHVGGLRKALDARAAKTTGPWASAIGDLLSEHTGASAA